MFVANDAEPNSQVKLTPYQKRKYVWKMLYIYVLGYEVDFGHMEALNLITTQAYAEKTGLSSVSLLLHRCLAL